MQYRPFGIFMAIAVTAAACGEKGAADAEHESALAFAVADAGLSWGPCPQIFPEGCEITVLRGDPAKPDADIYLRIPSGYEIPSHWHTSAERMILAAGELSVTYKGQSETILRAGDYAYGPAKLPHKAACIGAGPCTLFIAFDSPVDAHAGGL